MVAMTSHAAVVDFKVVADSSLPVNGPFPVGGEFTCTPIEDNNYDPIDSYGWRTQRTYPGGCAIPESGAGSDATMVNGAGTPVTITIKLTVKYQIVYSDDPNDPFYLHEDTVITKTITINKADNVEKPAGNANVPSPRDSQIEINYVVRRGTHDCAGIVGTVREKLTNRMYMSLPQPSIDWWPPAPTESFYLSDGLIYDTHSLDVNDAEWNSLNVNDPIESATQELQIVWSDPCRRVNGGLHFDQTLGTVDIVHRKTSATEWQVETN